MAPACMSPVETCIRSREPVIPFAYEKYVEQLGLKLPQ